VELPYRTLAITPAHAAAEIVATLIAKRGHIALLRSAHCCCKRLHCTLLAVECYKLVQEP
jgi:hypothetical protein